MKYVLKMFDIDHSMHLESEQNAGQNVLFGDVYTRKSAQKSVGFCIDFLSSPLAVKNMRGEQKRKKARKEKKEGLPPHRWVECTLVH